MPSDAEILNWRIHRMARDLSIGQPFGTVKDDFDFVALQRMTRSWIAWGCAPLEVDRYLEVMNVEQELRIAMVLQQWVWLQDKEGNRQSFFILRTYTTETLYSMILDGLL